MSELPATREYESACKLRVAEATPSTYAATRIEYTAGAMHDELIARVADLKEELAVVNSLLDMKREREQHWSDEAWRYKDMNEQLRVVATPGLT